MGGNPPKPIFWLGDSRKAIQRFPRNVRDEVGFALYLAQCGDTYVNAKPLKGFSGAGVLEVVADHDGDTYRCVHAVKFANVVYVLHAFQKKSKKGIATPKADIDLIRERLKAASEHHAAWRKQQR